MNASIFIQGVQEIYSTKGTIPLHEPVFFGNEALYVQKNNRIHIRLQCW